MVNLLICGCNRAREPSLPDLLIPNPLVIEAVGRDFLWHFRYPGTDGKLGTKDDLVVSKDLHLPLGHAIELRLTSDDYIYTFRSTELKLIEVAVPEMWFQLAFTTERPGKHELEVDPLCGVKFLHDDEMGWLFIEEEDSFRQWFREVESP